MHSLRRAALCLHALSKADQKWLLNALPSEHRQSLKGMLKELRMMGIPADSSLIPSVDDEAKDSVVAELQAERDVRSIIDRADEQQIRQIFDNEAPEIIATLLACCKWSWADSYLKSLPSDKRTGLLEVMESKRGKVSSKVADTLIGLLANELDPLSDSRFISVRRQI